MEQRAGRKIKSGSGKAENSCFIPATLPPQNPTIQYDDEILFSLQGHVECVVKLEKR